MAKYIKIVVYYDLCSGSIISRSIIRLVNLVNSDKLYVYIYVCLIVSLIKILTTRNQVMFACRLSY